MGCDMSDINFRQERIERLLQELRYEIERGMIEGEIEEALAFDFVVPTSKSIRGGVVGCSFRTRPVPRYMISGHNEPRLRIVK